IEPNGLALVAEYRASVPKAPPKPVPACCSGSFEKGLGVWRAVSRRPGASTALRARPSHSAPQSQPAAGEKTRRNAAGAFWAAFDIVPFLRRRLPGAAAAADAMRSSAVDQAGLMREHGSLDFGLVAGRKLVEAVVHGQAPPQTVARGLQRRDVA